MSRIIVRSEIFQTTLVRTWNFHVDIITFEGVSGSKQNLVGVFYTYIHVFIHVWNVGLVLKSKVIPWSWPWSWIEFWFSQKLCGAIPNFLNIFSIWRITFSNALCNPDPVHDPDPDPKKKTNSEKSLRNKTKFHEYHQHIKHNYIKINYQMISWSWSWSKFDWIKELTQIDWLKRV